MIFKKLSIKYSIPPELAYFIALAPLFNLFVMVSVPHSYLFYVAQFFAFIYLIVTPGLFILPLFTKKKMPFALGIALSVAMSMLCLMLMGLFINIVLPLAGIAAPLTTVPLLIAFDVLIILLFAVNAIYKKSFFLEIPKMNVKTGILLSVLIALPVLACAGSIILNNGGRDFVTMSVLFLIILILPIVVFDKGKLDPSVSPITLYFMALALLLMNSMRGWHITGHDILLEYHVFTLTSDAHLWKMAFYQDPYMACLSLTILPTYLQSLLHLDITYVFKFFVQFIGALPVVIVYYLNKKYLSEKFAILAGFLYITFPTFMVDMAFLNRQGIAFLFFGSMVYILLTTDYYTNRVKSVVTFLFGVGMIISHYSTSYIAVPLFIAAYIVNRSMRFVADSKWPKWLNNVTNKLGNREVYSKPVILTLPFVFGLLVVMVLWSSVITKTSKSFVNTIEQVIISLKHPFSLDEQTGPAKYSLVKAQQPTPEELLSRFVQLGIDRQKVVENQSQFFPLEMTRKYPATPVLELSATTTDFGKKVQSYVNINYWDFYNTIKQTYAKILQLLLIIGLFGLGIGYGFRRILQNDVPIEFIALSVAGIVVMVGQTILPAGAIDYGLLRLFQQNLIYLSLPIFLGLAGLSSLITKNHKSQIFICMTILLAFFLFLSGIIPQFTGGGRPLLALNNSGLYYDSYYTHAEEIASAQWLAKYKDARLPIQAAHFSDIKMIAYGHIGSYIELLPETTKKRSFVYLNYDNVKTNNILEIIYGDVVYYHFPMNFLRENKNLIYNNSGSQIYR